MMTAENRIQLERKGTLAVIRPEPPGGSQRPVSGDGVRVGAGHRVPVAAETFRAVLLTGTDGAFCSGADVRDFTAQLESGGPEGLSDHLRELADDLHRQVVMGIRRLDKPVVGRDQRRGGRRGLQPGPGL